MADGGIRRGQAFGRGIKRVLRSWKTRSASSDFNATAACALGIPLEQVLYSPSKRPFTVADKGKPITEIFG
jgi:hypothetical protein